MTEHKNQDTPLPCIWCNSDKVHIETNHIHGEDWYDAWVTCEICEADGPRPAVYGWLSSDDEARTQAIAAWNTRTPFTEQSQERDEPQLCAPFIGMDQPWTAGKVAEFDAAWNRRTAVSEQSQERTEALQALADEGQERGEYDMHKNQQNLYTSENCVQKTDISIHEPVAWMWSDNRGFCGSHRVMYSDVPPRHVTDAVPLYAAPLDAQAIRRKALTEALQACGQIAVLADTCNDTVFQIMDRIQALIDKEQP